MGEIAASSRSVWSFLSCSEIEKSHYSRALQMTAPLVTFRKKKFCIDGVFSTIEGSVHSYLYFSGKE